MNNITSAQFNKISSLALGASIGSASAIILDDESEDQKQKVFLNKSNLNGEISSPNADNSNIKKEISLWSFTRMYQLGGIPIMDFIVGYIFLYLLNKLVFKCDTKLIIFSIVPIVVLANIACNPQVKLTWFIIGIMILSIYFLIKID